MMCRLKIGLAALVVVLGFATLAGAQSWPAEFERLHVAPTETLVKPVAIVFAPDGRIFVAERRGRIQILIPDPGAPDPRTGYVLAPAPFLEIEDEVLNRQDEALLGLALDPDFDQNGWVYFAYVVETDPGNPDNYQYSYTRVERVQVAAADSNLADESTRQVLIGETWPEGITSAHKSHATGRLVFGDDKTLLVSHGDGAHYDGSDAGGRDDPQFWSGRTDPMEDVGAFRSQYLGSLSGKVLRVDKETGDGLPSNPWYEPGSPRSSASRTWAMGLRNPYRMDIVRGSGSTDPADGNPGRLYIGDVGWNEWEEVNVSDGGENFGWPCYEGLGEQAGYQGLTPAHSGCPPDDSGITPPVITWPHSGSNDSYPFLGIVGRAATGAALHSGLNYPAEYRGLLYFCEYGNSWIKGVRLDENGMPMELVNFGSGMGNPVELRVDPVSRDLFYISYANSRIYRFSYDGVTGIGADPQAPVGVVGTPGLGEVQLSWSSNPELDVVGYNVFRSADEGETWEQINVALVETTSFTDTGDGSPILAGEIYYYAVQAVDGEEPARSSVLSDPVVLAITSKAWEWYTTVPGASFTLDESPAPFPRTLTVANPASPNYDHWTTNDRAPQLRRTVSGDFVLETRIKMQTFEPGKNFHTGLMVGFGQFDLFYWGFYRGTPLRFERTGNGNLATVSYADSTVSLRVVKTGDDYSFEYRAQETDPWTVGATRTTSTPVQFAGSILKTWQSDVAIELRMEHLALDELHPVAQASATPSAGPTPLDVQFGSGSFDPDGDLLFHHWNLGDGTTSDLVSPQHSYGDVGEYTVVLRVTDAVGLTARDTLMVTAEGNHAPTASIVAPAEGLEYVFPDSSIALEAVGTDLEDDPASLSYAWSVDLIDSLGTSSGYLTPTPGSTSSFVPNTNGRVELDLVLTVTDSGGLVARDTVRIVDASLPPLPVFELRAELADGSGPPVVPGADGPWIDLAHPIVGPHAQLQGFAAPFVDEGWTGSGVPGAPYSLSFDGVDDVAVVSAGGIAGLQSGDAASVELWMRTPDDVQTRSYVLEWLEAFASPFDGMTLAIEAGTLRLYRDGWSTLASVLPSSWLHVIVAKSSSTWEAWIDGSLVASGPAPHLGAQSSELVLGAGTFAGAGQYSNYFSGELAEVRLYDRALSAANVQVLDSQPSAVYVNAPVLTSLSPDTVVDDGDAVDLHLFGRHFREGASVHASRQGESDLVATSVQWIGEDELSFDLPTLGAAVGDWDVVLTNPDAQADTLVGALAIRRPAPAFLVFDAGQADGSQPPVVPGASSPWLDTVSGAAMTLSNFDGDLSSGWQGDGDLVGPYRLRFDGVDDRASVDSLALGPIDSLVSIELWVSAGSQVEDFQMLAHHGYDDDLGTSGLSVALVDSEFVVQADESSGLFSLGPAQAGIYTQLVVTASADSVVLFRDGGLVGRFGRAVSALGPDNLALGAAYDGQGGYTAHFGGDLARVHVGARTLSALDVADSYAQHASEFEAPIAARLTLQPPWEAVGDSGTFAVAVHWDDQGNGFPLRAVQARLNWDPMQLELLSWAEGGLFSANGATGFVAADTSSSGEAVFDMAALGVSATLTGSGSLLDLEFRVAPSAAEQTTSLDLEVLQAVDASDPPQSIAALAVGGSRDLDFTPPAAVSTLVSDAGVGQVALSWSPPVDDYAGARIFVRPWSTDAGQGDPEYDDVSPAPSWPATLTEARNPQSGWSELSVGAQASSFLVAHPERTVLSVLVVSEDAAGNLADLATAPRMRTPSYPLGDVGYLDAQGNRVNDFDGAVDGILDLPLFSMTYTALDGAPEYDAFCDIGPTEDGTPDTAPLTDDSIDFEDLMIFSQTFGTSNLSKDGSTVLALGRESSGPLRLRGGDPELVGDPGAMSGEASLRLPIELSGNDGQVRAVHLVLDYDEHALELRGFEASGVLQRERESVLSFVAPLGPGRVALDLCVLGERAYLDGDGRLGVLHFAIVGGESGSLRVEEADLRGVRGEALSFVTDGLAREQVVPSPVATRLLPASPNPFNPATVLRFELASGSRVRMRIYDVSGRRVHAVLDREMPAGYHRVTWNGVDDRGNRVSSGVYLAELVAEGHRSVQKMMLVK